MPPMTDEGYIKFHPHWTPTPALAENLIAEINHWRQQLYNCGLIGAYPDGIGFGNISSRYGNNSFLISGSATGNLPTLDGRHYSLVTKVNVASNELWCEGPVLASSESMSHAAVYRLVPSVQAVVHIHHLGLWEQLLYKVPTTDETATYGSPEMVYAIETLFADTPLHMDGLFVMAGHREGIFTFGESLEQAAMKAMDLLKE